MSGKRPYQVVCNADDPQWHQHRLLLATGSEMPTIMGEAPSWFSTTRGDLIRAKRQRIQHSFPTTRRMWWGSAAERGNIACFSKLTGLRTRPTNTLLASTKARIGATLDGLVLVPGRLDKADYLGHTSEDNNIATLLAELEDYEGLLPLEAKQSDGWKNQVDEWTKAVPRYYWIQVQTQLYVTGLPAGIIFCRLGVADLRAHLVPADEWFFEQMEESVEEFWKEVADD